MFPGDLEETLVLADPLKTSKPAAVHLGHQPGLETDPPGLHAHGQRVGALEELEKLLQPVPKFREKLGWRGTGVMRATSC